MFSQALAADIKCSQLMTTLQILDPVAIRKFHVQVPFKIHVTKTILSNILLENLLGRLKEFFVHF